jgi:hypothetical protein
LNKNPLFLHNLAIFAFRDMAFAKILHIFIRLYPENKSNPAMLLSRTGFSDRD